MFRVPSLFRLVSTESFIYILACKDSSYLISQVSGVWGESHNLVWDVAFAVNRFCLLTQSCQYLVLVLMLSCRLGRVRRSSPFFFFFWWGKSFTYWGLFENEFSKCQDYNAFWAILVFDLQ